jgi:hypothetical protein
MAYWIRCLKFESLKQWQFKETARFCGEEVHFIDTVLLQSKNKLWRKFYIKYVVSDFGNEILVKRLLNNRNKN